jgi:hypothetical protein
MPDAIAIEQFERRLIELGCPSRRLREKVRELSEHYHDLKEAALAEGCSEIEADARASAWLGDPVVLAENLMIVLRQASWWGRHPLIGFGLLPVLTYIFIWAGCLGLLVGICRFLGWLAGPAYNLDDASVAALQDDSRIFYGIEKPLKDSLDIVACVLLTRVFCWLAWRSGRGWKWVIATCGACSLASAMVYTWLQPHNLSVGLSWPFAPGWPTVVPAVAAVAAFVYQRRLEGRLAPIPRMPDRARPSPDTRSDLLRRCSLTPTHLLVTLMTVGIVALVMVWQNARRTEAGQNVAESARHAELKNSVWAAERAATLALLKSRQQILAGGGETTIDLRPWLNMSLTASASDSVDARKNNLASLPAGIHIFAGVPFDVAGRAQLVGRTATQLLGRFPTGIRNIPIGDKCDRIHLLHGASNLSALGREIARLVLHYENGTQARIGIVGGSDVLDWWGPIYNTDSGIGRYVKSPGAELAWVGTNPWIKARAPDFSLRLYRSTFANPHPDLAIKSVDYVSTLTDANPFLVGLTVEQSNH